MLVDKTYQLLDKGPIRALILILALVTAGAVMWIQPYLLRKRVHFRYGKAVVNMGNMYRDDFWCGF